VDRQRRLTEAVEAAVEIVVLSLPPKLPMQPQR